MGRLLRAAILVLALCCPSFASATAPTPQGIVDIGKLFGFDALIDLVFQKQFDSNEIIKTLAPEKKNCLLVLVRGDMRTAMGKSMREMFADQDTIADWLEFSRTSGGGRFLQVIRDTMMATATGEKVPDLASAMSALSPAETAEVFVFLQSPSARVMDKGFPELRTSEDAPMEQKFAQCGIVAGLT